MSQTERVIEYPVEETFIREQGDTTQIAILQPYSRSLGPDGVEYGTRIRNYVLYQGEVETATVRRHGIRREGELSATEFTTPAIQMRYPQGTRAELIRATQGQLASGGTSVLRLRIPMHARG